MDISGTSPPMLRILIRRRLRNNTLKRSGVLFAPPLRPQSIAIRLLALRASKLVLWTELRPEMPDSLAAYAMALLLGNVPPGWNGLKLPQLNISRRHCADC